MREERQCAICMERDKNAALQCGHQLCWQCAHAVAKCPVCRAAIITRIKLF